MSTVNQFDMEIEIFGECNVPACARSVYSKGFCNLHYQRNRKLLARGVKPSRYWIQWFEAMNEPASQPRTNPEGVAYRCSESGCKNDVFSKGLCSKHYIKKRRER